MGHSGQVGGSLQQGCYPPTSWLQPQLILPLQSFPPSFLPCIPTTREKSTSTHPCLAFDLLPVLFSKLLLEAHFQLTVLWPQSRTFAPFESGLSVHRNTEPNLHHTGGVKGITMGQCKKRENETTQKQHKNSTERRREMGRKVQGKKQNTRVHKCRKL